MTWRSGKAGPSGQHIVLTGAMGVGKTTVGEGLAGELGVPFLDSDTELEERTGETGAVIAAQDGVERLHELELEVFGEMCRQPPTVVIATAASVVDHEAGREALAANLTVWLTAPTIDLEARRTAGNHRREIDAREQLALDTARSPFLRRVASLTVDTGSKRPGEVVREIVDRLHELARR